LTTASVPSPGRLRTRVLTMSLVLVVVALVTLCAPLRYISGDTVPGRLGAAVLRCGGGFDLGTVDWIAARATSGRLPYWARRTEDKVISVYGPGPAIAGALALPAMANGDVMEDAMLRRRERLAAALLLGLAAALLVLATAARRGLAVSAGVGLVASASFAGAATLGQGLWQQTVVLPFVVGALATLAWRHRASRCAMLTPALLVIAVLLRPTIAPLAAGLGLAWCVDRGTPRRAAAAIGLAALVTVPLIVWNLVELDTILPIGQLEANARVSNQVFVLTRAQLGYGLGGLLISPGRGWVWFAPIALLGAILAASTGAWTARLIALGIVAQLGTIAMFHMWWGGICFGPRFLAEATWVGTWLALGGGGSGTGSGRLTRVLSGLAILITIGVGQLGLWGWHAEQWESRRNPDLDQNALWDFVDSPVVAILTADVADELVAVDALEEGPRMVCQDGTLRQLP
jgi:hypothetical protein